MSTKTILVKIGGEVAESKDTAETLLQDLVELKSQGYRVVLCHGGGPQITRELKNRGVEARFVNGQRVTDAETLKLTCQILLGEINCTLVSLCNKKGFAAVGLSGLDAGLYQSKSKDASLGFVGQIEKVNLEHINSILSQGLIPIVASIGIGMDGQIYNINADSAAGELARALEVEQYLVFTNVDGLYRNFPDKDSLIKQASLSEIKDLMAGGSIVEGMIPKLESVISALDGKVGKAVIVDGRKDHAILNVVQGLKENRQIYGTVITK